MRSGVLVDGLEIILARINGPHKLSSRSHITSVRVASPLPSVSVMTWFCFQFFMKLNGNITCRKRSIQGLERWHFGAVSAEY